MKLAAAPTMYHPFVLIITGKNMEGRDFVPILLINLAFLLDGKESIDSSTKKLASGHSGYGRRRNTRREFRGKMIKNTE
jgi:hypothetical protein